MQSFCQVTGLLLAVFAVLPSVVIAASTASLRGATTTTTTPETALSSISTEELQKTAAIETANNENGPHEDSDLLPASSRALQQRFGGRFSSSNGSGSGSSGGRSNSGYYPTTSSSSLSNSNTNQYPYANTVGTGYTGYFGGSYGSGFGGQLQQYYQQGDYGPGSNSLNFYEQRPTTGGGTTGGGAYYNNYYEDYEGDYYYDDYDFDYYDDYDFDDYDYDYDSPETRPCPATQVYCPAFEDCIPAGYCPTGGNNSNDGNTNNNQNFSTGTLVAQIATLEDKMGPISGQVSIVFESDGNFQFQYELQGIEATCVNCGVQ